MSKQYMDRLREKGIALSANDKLNVEIEQARKDAKLDDWTSFVEELKVPSEIYPAMLTMRPELIKAAQPRALTAEECKVLYDIIAGLIGTNAALRMHCERAAQLVDNWAANFKALQRTGERIQAFANFQTIGDPPEEEADAA